MTSQASQKGNTVSHWLSLGTSLLPSVEVKQPHGNPGADPR